MFSSIKVCKLSIALSILATNISYTQDIYVSPPTQVSSGYVPVISDEQMEKCVKMYNEAKWIQDELSRSSIDMNSNKSVDNYNLKVRKVNDMINWFNANCAGKQSRSACEAANKLNLERGLPTQSCH